MKNKISAILLLLSVVLTFSATAQQLQWQLVLLKKPNVDVAAQYYVVYQKAEDALASQLVSGEYEVASKNLLDINDASADDQIYQLVNKGINLALRYQFDITTEKAAVVKYWRLGLSAYLVDLESKKQIESAEIAGTYNDVPNNCEQKCFEQWLAGKAADLAQEMGAIFVEKLDHLPKRYRYELAFTGFLGDELEQVRQYLKQVDGYLFANLKEKLKSQGQLLHQLEGAKYQYLSNLPPDELDGALYTQLQAFGIPVLQAKSRGHKLHFARSSMPYWWAYLIVLLVLLSTAYFVYRASTLKKHQLQFDKFAHHNQAQQWIDYQHNLKLAAIAKPNHWYLEEKVQSSAVQQAKNLSEQAWLLADQADYTQAQLKVTEALQINADDKQAIELKDNIVNYQRGHDRYLLATKELSSHPEQAAALLKEAAALNPHLSEKISKLSKQNNQAMQRAESQSAIKQTISAIELKQFNKAYSIIDTHLAKYNMDVASEEFTQLAELRRGLAAHFEPILGACVGNGVLSGTTFYTSGSLQLGRKCDDPQNSFGIRFRRNSRVGKQNIFTQKGQDFFVTDQASSNGSNYDSVQLIAGQAVKIKHQGLLATGGAPNNDSLGMCQIKTLLAQKGPEALILKLNTNAFQFVDDTNIGNAWPSLDQDLASRWVMIDDEIYIGIDDSGKIDLGCISGSHCIARLSYDKGFYIAPDFVHNDKSQILMGDQVVYGKVPIKSGAKFTIAGQTFSLQGV